MLTVEIVYNVADDALKSGSLENLLRFGWEGIRHRSIIISNRAGDSSGEGWL